MSDKPTFPPNIAIDGGRFTRAMCWFIDALIVVTLLAGVACVVFLVMGKA